MTGPKNVEADKAVLESWRGYQSAVKNYLVSAINYKDFSIIYKSGFLDGWESNDSRRISLANKR